VPTIAGPLVKTRSQRPCRTYFELTFKLQTNKQVIQHASDVQTVLPQCCSLCKLRYAWPSIAALTMQIVFAAAYGVLEARDGDTAIVALLLLCNLQLDPNTAFIFQNFYCSHISIKQLQQRSQSSSSSSCSESLHRNEQQQWVTVLPPYALMASPHYEDDAQHWHVLPVSALTAAFDAASAAPLRVFLHQPSPLWDSMELRHFKCAVLPDPAEVCSFNYLHTVKLLMK
jgi:hypothetical protein